jgi:hypothetical protein
LIDDGSRDSQNLSIRAPISLDGVPNFTVEAQVQLVKYANTGATSGENSFGVIVRSTGSADGYGGGHCVSSGIFSCASNQPDQRVAILWTADSKASVLGMALFRPAGDWHTYRVEVRGDNLSLLIDGGVVATATDNTYVKGAVVGLWSASCQLNVRSFTVTAP